MLELTQKLIKGITIYPDGSLKIYDFVIRFVVHLITF